MRVKFLAEENAGAFDGVNPPPSLPPCVVYVIYDMVNMSKWLHYYDSIRYIHLTNKSLIASTERKLTKYVDLGQPK